MPEWYRHLRAARYLGVPPWELAHQPTYWREMALAASNAEDRARDDDAAAMAALFGGGKRWH